MPTIDPRFVPYLEFRPEVAPDAFVADTARLIGRVKLGARASVWYGAVLRADINAIEIGDGTNIQDGSVLHVEDWAPCRVGKDVVVGHAVVLHGCTVGAGSLIGMGSVILTGAEIGSGCLVAARSLVLQDAKIPAGSLVMGYPAKVVRPLTEDERGSIVTQAGNYVRVAANYRR